MNTKRKYGSKDLEKRLGSLTIGEFLKTWRTTEEMTAKELSDKIGISTQNLCDIEKGRKGVSPAKANEMAKVLRLPPTLLVKLALDSELRDAGLKFTVEIRAVA